MSETKRAFVSDGAGLVWRRQRVLWWAYVVNLVLAFFAIVPTMARLSAVLDHSLAARGLENHFRLSVLSDLASLPGNPLGGQSAGMVNSVLFLLFMLFITGGLLETYRLDTAQGAEPFFQACGQYFWRMVRLMILFLIVMAPFFLGLSLVTRWSGKMANNAAPPLLGFVVQVTGYTLLLLLMMAMRLWFDMAEIRTVAENEYAVRRSVVAAFRIVARNFGRLFSIYFRIGIQAWLALLLIFWVWIKFVPSGAVTASFLVFQLLLLFWLATRFWQRAAETLWYVDWSSKPQGAPVYPDVGAFRAAPPATPEREGEAAPDGEVAVEAAATEPAAEAAPQAEPEPPAQPKPPE